MAGTGESTMRTVIARQKLEASVTFTDADRARALARFRSLRGQGGVVIGFAAVGPMDEAATPAELSAACGTKSGSLCGSN